MRRYWIIVRQSFVNQLAYGAGIYVWFGIALLEILIPMMIWVTASSPSGSFSGFTKPEIITYYILIGLIGNITFWWVHFDIERKVRSGSMSLLLLQPFSALSYLIFRQLGDKIMSVVLRLPFFLLIMYYLHISIDLNISVLLAVVLGFFTYLLISALFGMLSFWVTDTGGFVGAFYFFAYLLSGELAPLAFYPEWFRVLTTYLPYRYVLSFPIEIILHKLSSAEILIGFLMGTGWLAILFALLKILWSKALRAYQAYGN